MLTSQGTFACRSPCFKALGAQSVAVGRASAHRLPLLSVGPKGQDSVTTEFRECPTSSCAQVRQVCLRSWGQNTLTCGDHVYTAAAVQASK